MALFLWLRELYASFASVLRPMTAESVEDIPDVLQPHSIYFVGDEGRPWAAAFLCPCQCGDVIQLSLIENDRPRWRARVHENRSVTLDPSVWRTRGCFSHFFVRRGRIWWAVRGRPPSGRSPSSSRRYQ